jgi:DsbC/DsbD-like thiol-disulfide interchange protein
MTTVCDTTTAGDRLRPTAARPARLSPMDLSKTLGTSLLSAALIGTGLIAADVAVAEDASAWNGDATSAVRLIAGDGAGTRAAIELRLKDGWHTYWRYPGDAGVPPHFDFSGSDNVKTVNMLWPAPQRIAEEGLVAIGYVKDLTWPLVIVPQNPAKPVTLRLKLDYAVCEKRCVPAQGQAELKLAAAPAQTAAPQGLLSRMPPAQGTTEATIAAALARVPKKLALGEGSPLSIRSVKREGTRAIVDVAAPPGAELALFAEGPTSAWALPVPTAVAGAPAGLQRFAFDLDGAPPGAKYEGAAITLTAVAGEDAIEVATHLD